MHRSQPDGFWQAQRAALAALEAPTEASHNLPCMRKASEEANAKRVQDLLHSNFPEVVATLDTPLMDAGLDSSDVSVFVNLLNAAFEVKLPHTLLFESSNIRGIAKRMAWKEDVEEQVEGECKRLRLEPKNAAMSSVAGRWPGMALAQQVAAPRSTARHGAPVACAAVRVP